MAGPCFGELCTALKACLIADGRPLAAFQELTARAADVAPQDVAPQPLVNGEDLMRLGLTQGPIFKKILDEIYYKQLNLELSNRKEALGLAAQLANPATE